jgi:aflatoxin B1 aldehyde reductase
MASSNHPKVLLGLNGFFIKQGLTAEEAVKVLEHMQTLPIKITGIDTAAAYPPTNPGESELVLGEAGVGGSGFTVDTKVLIDRQSDGSGELGQDNITKSIVDSLAKLKMSKVQVLYAHREDPTTPAFEIASGFAKAVKEGRCEMVSFAAVLVGV